MRNIAIIVLGIFGLTLVIPSLYSKFELLASKMVSSSGVSSKKREGFVGGVIIGISIGIFWTPCVGPILASVISLAASSKVSGEAILITLSFSIGTAIPMLLIAYGGRSLLNRYSFFTRKEKWYG